MPQANDELRALWHEKGDVGALDYLSEKFSISYDGVIYPEDSEYCPTKEELSAIDYLIWEWDYVYKQRKD